MRRATDRPTTVALVVACAYFMENFDGTVIATALPSMARSFATSVPATSFGMTAYMLAVAMFIPVSGWLADRYGCRAVFRAAIGIFTVASLLCALAQTLPGFAAARALQGAGGAMMLPVGRLIVLRSVSRADYVRAMSWVTMPGVVGQIAGPLCGGFFASYLNWRWIFAINVPIGFAGIALVTWLIDDLRGDPHDDADTCFDWRGACLVALATGCAVGGLNLAASTRDLARVALLLGVALAAGATALRHLQTSRIALLDLKLLAHATFARGVSGSFLFRVAAAGLGFLLPLLLQIGLGMTPFVAGLLVFGSALGAFAMKRSAPRVLKRFGFRSVLLYNGLLCAASIAVCALFGMLTPVWLIAVLLLAGGFARSLQFAALNAVIYADVEPPRMSAATSFASLLQPLASACGIAVSAWLLRGLSSGAANAADVTLPALRDGLFATGLLALYAAWPFYRLAPGAGAEMSGRAAPAAMSRPAKDL